jgi:hypothetical protein
MKNASYPNIARLALLALAALHAPFARAVTETAVEFHAAADFNGDGLADVVVVDRASGMVRVGLAREVAGHDWQLPVFSGIEQPTGVAVGRLTAGDRSALAVTGPQANRVQILEWTADAVMRPLTVTVGGVGPNGVAALEIGGAGANASFDDLAVASLWSGADSPNRLDLVRTLGGGDFSALADSVTPTADDQMQQLRAFRASRNPAVKPLLAMIRQSFAGTRFTLSEVFTGTVALDIPTASRTGIPFGSRYVSGFFGTEGNVSPWPRVIFYNANNSQTESHALEYGGDPSQWFFVAGAPQIINYPNAVKSITVVPRADPLPDRLLVLFATGPVRAALYDYDGVNFPTLVRELAVPVPGGDFSGAVVTPDGGFVMLTGDSFNRTTGSHSYNSDGMPVPKSASDLMSLRSYASRANLLFYNLDPAVALEPKLLGSYSTGDWTGKLSLGATAEVTREHFLGGSLGLRGAQRVDAGAPPAGTGAGRANQNAGPAGFQDAISYFSLGGARGREVQDAEIDPPPGNYTRAVRVALHPAPGTTVKYRARQGFFGPQQDWQTWGAGSRVDFFDSGTVEYFAEEGGLRGAVRTAVYNLNIPDQDSDEDGVPDPFELLFGLDPNGGLDSDGDGVSDLVELLIGTDPNQPDAFPAGFASLIGLRNGETFQLAVTARAVNGRSSPESLTWPLAGTRIFGADFRGNATVGSVEPPDPLPPGMPGDSGVALLNDVPAGSIFPFVTLRTQPTFSVTSKTVKSVRVDIAGSGYGAGTTAVPVGGGGAGAELEAVVEDGVISEVRVVKTGADYTTGGLVSFQPAPAGDAALALFLIGPGPMGREMLALAPEPATERVSLNYFFPGGDPQAAFENWLSQMRAAYGIVSVPVISSVAGANQIITTAVPHGLEAGDAVVLRGMTHSMSGDPAQINGAHLVREIQSPAVFTLETAIFEGAEGGFLIKAGSYGPQTLAEAELTHQSTLHALLVEDALARRLGIADLTLFPGRDGDEDRQALKPEDLERLERPEPGTGAFKVSHIHEVLLHGLEDPDRPATVDALVDLVRRIYAASSRRDTPSDEEPDPESLGDFVRDGDTSALPPAYVNPVDAIRHLLAHEELPAPYDQDAAMSGADFAGALGGLAHLRDLITPRPLVEVALEVPMSGFFDGCTVLREAGGWEDYALVAADGRPFRLPDNFRLVPGMRFRVLGYMDVPMACWQQNTIEVARMEITDYPERVFDDSAPTGQSIVFTPPATHYLDQGALDLSLHAQSSSGLPVEFELVSGDAALAGGILTFNSAGTVRVRASQPGDAQYRPARDVLRNIRVLRTPGGAALVLTGLAQTYDGTPRVVGVLNAAGAAAVEYRIGGVFGATAPVLPGSYAVRATSDGSTRAGTLVVAKAPLFVVPDDQRKFAGEPNPELTFGYHGFVPGDKPAGSITRAPVLRTSARPNSPGGEYPITAGAAQSDKYRFIYERGTLFVDSFFGRYEALLRLGEEDGFAPVGKLEVNVPRSGRSFTGRLLLASERRVIPLRGPLETNAKGSLAIGKFSRHHGAGLYELIFQIARDGPLSAGLALDKSELAGAANGRKLLSLSARETVPYAGAHTMVVTPLTETGQPAGAGWAGAAINTKGVLRLVGRLGDGTGFSVSLPPDDQENPGYRLFAQPYRPARSDSYVAADFVLKPHPDLPERRYLDFKDLSELAWVKTGQPRDSSYRSGIPLAYTSFTLDPWLPPVRGGKNTTAVTLGGRLGLVAPDNTLTVQHSSFPSASFGSLPVSIELNPENQRFEVKSPADNPTKWRMNVNSNTGTFSGQFQLVDPGSNRRVNFTGALRQPASTDQDGIMGDGVFLLRPLPGSGTDEQVAGEVRLDLP